MRPKKLHKPVGKAANNGLGLLYPNPGAYGASAYGAEPRDLAALLAHGPGYLPFTAAWTDSRTEQVRAYKNWVYVAVSTVAAHVASVAPNVTWVHDDATETYEYQGGENVTSLSPPRRKWLPGKKAFWDLRRQKALTPLLTHEQLEPVPSDNWLCKLLADPNEPDTSYDLWYETVMFLLLTGSAYWWLPKKRLGGKPAAIWVLPSHWVYPIAGRGEHFYEGWELRPTEGTFLRRVFPDDEVLHFHLKNPVSKYDGHSPLTAGAKWVDVTEKLAECLWWTYENGAFPTLAVQFDAKYQDPSDEDLKRIEARFINRFVGPTRTNKPLWLPPGVTAKPLTIKANEMVFGETSDKTRDNTLALFKVPTGMVVSDANMDLECQQKFHSNAVNPLLRFLGQAITVNLARRHDKKLRVWWEDRTPDDPEAIEKRIQTDLMAGAITPNIIALMRGREPFPYEWADLPIRPVNMSFTRPDGTIQPLSLPNGGSHAPPAESHLPVSQPRVSEETSFSPPFSRNGKH